MVFFFYFTAHPLFWHFANIEGRVHHRGDSNSQRGYVSKKLYVKTKKNNLGGACRLPPWIRKLSEPHRLYLLNLNLLSRSLTVQWLTHIYVYFQRKAHMHLHHLLEYEVEMDVLKNTRDYLSSRLVTCRQTAYQLETLPDQVRTPEIGLVSQKCVCTCP